MNDINKMLKTIINGQSALKEELLRRIDKTVAKLSRRINGLEKKTESGFKEVNERLDKIGKQTAFLEEDTPTRKEHNQLEKRVGKLEHQYASV
jgi:predicted nuclease with TOPRIM domain